jgi:flagella synthesis protein FlgN
MPTNPLPAAELTVLREFTLILQQEQAALTTADIDTLARLLPEKTRCASELIQFSEQRSQFLLAENLTADRSGMELWITRQTHGFAPADTARLRSDWNTLLALANEARTLNELNGQLLMTRMQHNQHMLNTLLAASNQAMLYGPDGQTHGNGGGRLFGSA